MSTKDDFNDDLPDMPIEPDPPPPTIVVIAEDLRLGPAEVKPYDRNAWMKEFGPKPPGPEIIALDILTVVLGCILLYFLFKSWLHVFS